MSDSCTIRNHLGGIDLPAQNMDPSSTSISLFSEGDCPSGAKYWSHSPFPFIIFDSGRGGAPLIILISFSLIDEGGHYFYCYIAGQNGSIFHFEPIIFSGASCLNTSSMRPTTLSIVFEPAKEPNATRSSNSKIQQDFMEPAPHPIKFIFGLVGSRALPSTSTLLN